MSNVYVEVVQPTVKSNVSHKKIQRVAAYCRVSTDDEEQLSSYENQITTYTDRIRSNPDWEFVGVFADEGITGTSTKKRDDFNKLMNLCRRGKVDTILTKSISRFSRNTLDCIGNIRKLRDLGVNIIFEKEGINTATMGSEMILTLLAAFAQSESESISANVALGKRSLFKQGKIKVQYNKLFGYRADKNGECIIIEEEAKVVRAIFANYLGGMSLTDIRRWLEKEGIKSRRGKDEWSEGALKYLLQNEKYCGDVIAQKTFVENCITGKVKQNNGELPKYYIRDHHPAIIDRQTFSRAQEEMAKRSAKRRSSARAKTEQGKYSGKYALSELLYCGMCGSRYRRVTWNIRGNKKIVWRCINRIDFGTKYCTDSPSIEESELHGAILRSIKKLGDNRNDVLDMLKENMASVIEPKSDVDSIYAHQSRVKELETDRWDLIKLSSNSDAVPEFFDERIKTISAEIEAHNEAIAKLRETQDEIVQEQYRLKHLFEVIGDEDFSVTGYDEITVRRLIDEIKVIDRESISVLFKGGIEIKERIKK